MKSDGKKNMIKIKLNDEAIATLKAVLQDTEGEPLTMLYDLDNGFIREHDGFKKDSEIDFNFAPRSYWDNEMSDSDIINAVEIQLSNIIKE